MAVRLFRCLLRSGVQKKNVRDLRRYLSPNEAFAVEYIASISLAVKIFSCSVLVIVLICCVRVCLLDLITY